MNWIDQGIQFFSIADVALIARMIAGRVNAICEEDDGFASLLAVESLIDDQINCVIELCAAARARARIASRRNYGCRRFGQHPHLFVKGDDYHAVVRA